MTGIPPKSQRKFWLVEIWEEYRELFKGLVAFALITGMFLGILWLFSLALDKVNLPAEERKPFAKTHYWGNLIAFIIFVLGSILEVVIFTYRRLRK